MSAEVVPMAVKSEAINPTEATILAWAVDYDGSGSVYLMPMLTGADPSVLDPRRSKGNENVLAVLLKITVPLDALRRLR
jgi:hypothetical protein